MQLQIVPPPCCNQAPSSLTYSMTDCWRAVIMAHHQVLQSWRMTTAMPRSCLPSTSNPWHHCLLFLESVKEGQSPKVSSVSRYMHFICPLSPSNVMTGVESTEPVPVIKMLMYILTMTLTSEASKSASRCVVKVLCCNWRAMNHGVLCKPNCLWRFLHSSSLGCSITSSTKFISTSCAPFWSLVWYSQMKVTTVRATPSKLPKRASCRLYKNSGSDEMRLMGDRDRIRSGTVGGGWAEIGASHWIWWSILREHN